MAHHGTTDHSNRKGMIMRNRFNVMLAATAFAIGLTGAAAVFAQQAQQTPAQPPAAGPATPGMMQGQGMMGQQGEGMMPMMNMMTQMSQMMETCNKMMQQAMTPPQGQGAAPQKQGG
ncbi:hypothetical protein [Inquilinus sp. Marseille-Q2685]|uniref:hypothetical protein n=1 Tax=Inquilinus sp. Marseille-Q2685 TaxID=2866581 RepID=UPI001CE3F391|nr:hypothetical protein [Inquilinus sp. Marseille-Q2685]